MENMYDISEVEDARGAYPHKYKAPFYPLAASPMMSHCPSATWHLSYLGITKQKPAFSRIHAHRKWLRFFEQKIQESATFYLDTHEPNKKHSRPLELLRKPAWALTQDEAQQRQDDEEMALIEYSQSLNYDTLINEIHSNPVDPEEPPDDHKTQHQSPLPEIQHEIPLSPPDCIPLSPGHSHDNIFASFPSQNPLPEFPKHPIDSHDRYVVISADVVRNMPHSVSNLPYLRLCPSMSLKFIRENVEPIGWNSVDTRTSQMNTFYGLGPPDLCRLSKQDPLKNRRTYFHNVIGLNTGSLSSITGYLTGLMDASDSSVKIDAATYCTWDIFTNSDIRVTVKNLSGTSNIPTIAVHCVTAQGAPTSPDEQVPQEVWEGVFVSSFLRSHSVDVISNSSSILTLNTLPGYRTPEEEKLFSKLILKFFHSANSTGIPRGSKRGTNILVTALCDMYIRNRRLKESINIFSTFQSVYPPILIYMAIAHLKQGNRKAALSVLVQALTEFPEDDSMLTLMSRIVAQDESQLFLAYRAIQGAASVGPGNPWVWLEYADICRKQKKFDRSLLALNNALDDMIPIGDHETAVVVPTSVKLDTIHPQNMWGIGTYCELWSKPRNTAPDTYLSYSHVDHLILGPGSGLTTWFDDTLSAPPQSVQQTEKSPNLFRKMNLARSDKFAYKILVKIREDLGWDALMDVRRSVFGGPNAAVDNFETDLNITNNTSMDSSFATAFFEEEDPINGQFGSPICCRKLDKFFHLLRDDLESMFTLKKEIKEGIVQARIAPEGLCRRIETCARFHKMDYLEICCRVYLGIRKCFDPFVYRCLTKVYLEANLERETFAVLVGLWLNIEGRIFPTMKNFSLPPWLAPSVRTQGYRPYNHCPPWIMELVSNIVGKFGVSNLRKYIQNDNRLIVLDQILAHYQVVDLQ